MSTADPERRRFLLLSLALTVVGFALREAYVLSAVVDTPISGDSLEYWRYAWNLLHHHVFSVQAPSPRAPLPDSWRAPAFPALLAWCLGMGEEGALQRAQQLLVLLGTALIPASIALGRVCLSRPLALLAGALVAFWPHLVVFSSVTMSETPFALGLVATALLVALAERRASLPLSLLAGLAAGLTALVNPVFVLFPFAAAALLLLRRQSRVALGYLLAFALVAGGWTLRNAGVPPGRGSAERVQANLVQGSWPLFHAAWNNRRAEPMAAAYMREVDVEIARMQASPAVGLRDMAARLASEPGAYLRWYLLEKPYLLWGWSILIGPGDIYMFPTSRSLFERVPLLHGMKSLARAANPLLFALALFAAVRGCWRIVSRRGRLDAAEGTQAALGLLFFYLTAVHVVLQSEPRYGIAYRPIEFLLAAAALAMLVAWRSSRRVAT